MKNESPDFPVQFRVKLNLKSSKYPHNYNFQRSMYVLCKERVNDDTHKK